MALVPLTERTEIRSAFTQFSQRLASSCLEIERYLGYGNGRAPYLLRWYPAQAFWSVLETERPDTPGRYWCAYGTQDPQYYPTPAITCEINMAFAGVRRQLSGYLARDPVGELHLLHKGKISGGREGIGQTTFLAFYRERTMETLHWPDGKSTSAILIGRVETDDFIDRLGTYVHVVERFKQRFGTLASRR